MKMMNGWFGLAVGIAALALGGCATPATARGMTVTGADIGKEAPAAEIARAFGVGEVVGGSETSRLDKSKIANGDFEQALAGSLEAAQLLAKSSPRYRVKVTLQQLEQPDGGIDMTVVSQVRYVVSDERSGRILLDEIITSYFTAHLGDAPVGTVRLRLATEGAARKSIASFIAKARQLRVGTWTA